MCHVKPIGNGGPQHGCQTAADLLTCKRRCLMKIAKQTISRRAFLRAAATIAAVGVAWREVFTGAQVSAQSTPAGLPLPDEAVEATLKRLFGNRILQSGAGKIKLDLPLIAEDGGNVGVTIESDLPVAGALHLKHVYIVSDKNRRPMLAKFTFMAGAGRAFIATSVRLAATTDVRAVAEMSDGTLYAVTKNVRVTISGCDLPPQS
jgi:sulfur-oxidizing protein SoxY